MKMLIRILTAPIGLFVWLCAGLLYVSTFLFGLAGSILAVLGVIVLLTGALKNGLIVLVIAFLVSPMGIPMLAVRLLSDLQQLRYWLVNRF